MPMPPCSWRESQQSHQEENITGDPVILLPDLEGSEAQGKAGGHVACPQLLLLGLMCGELAPFPTLRHSTCSEA